jgi:hypothetical protein
VPFAGCGSLRAVASWTIRSNYREQLLGLLELDYAGSGTQVSTTFLSETYQIRVSSDVWGYLCFGSTAPTTTSRDTVTMELYANASPEYVTVSPGQFVSFSSSSTSSDSVFG